jgi:hypothetical protein
MKSYQELIKDDKFDVKDEYTVNTEINKCCWGCEKGCKEGHMVWNNSKTRRIFFCDDCFKKLKD